MRDMLKPIFDLLLDVDDQDCVGCTVSLYISKYVNTKGMDRTNRPDMDRIIGFKMFVEYQ